MVASTSPAPSLGGPFFGYVELFSLGTKYVLAGYNSEAWKLVEILISYDKSGPSIEVTED